MTLGPVPRNAVKFCPVSRMSFATKKFTIFLNLAPNLNTCVIKRPNPIATIYVQTWRHQLMSQESVESVNMERTNIDSMMQKFQDQEMVANNLTCKQN